MNFEESIPYSLAQIATAYKIGLEKSMGAIDLHGGQVFVLLELWKSDGRSQIEIAAALKVSAPTVNKMVKSLAAAGFVKCRQCPSDGRLMRVFLTEKGRAIRPAVEKQWGELEAKIFLNLTETEKLVLVQLCGKIRDNLSPGQ
jgi:MarR family transcriptional regulator, organic hydroperoxide resistance regulator